VSESFNLITTTSAAELMSSGVEVSSNGFTATVQHA
jgi:hypothetical protein